jgi:hypothetical protein
VIPNIRAFSAASSGEHKPVEASIGASYLSREDCDLVGGREKSQSAFRNCREFPRTSVHLPVENI